MYAARGLGATIMCPDGTQSNEFGDCPDSSLISSLDSSFAAIQNPFSTGADASTSLAVTVPTGLTLNAQGQIVQQQTFAQWVEANSTLLLVAFGAFGALVAFTRVGK